MSIVITAKQKSSTRKGKTNFWIVHITCPCIRLKMIGTNEVELVGKAKAIKANFLEVNEVCVAIFCPSLYLLNAERLIAFSSQ